MSGPIDNLNLLNLLGNLRLSLRVLALALAMLLTGTGFVARAQPPGASTQAVASLHQDYVGAYRAVISWDTQGCIKAANDQYCYELFAYLALLPDNSVELQERAPNLSSLLGGIVVTQTPRDWLSLCTDPNSRKCVVFRAALNPDRSKRNEGDACLTLAPAERDVCADVRAYQDRSCPAIKSPFLKSACTKVPTPECLSNFACATAIAELTGVARSSQPAFTASLQKILTEEHKYATSNLALGQSRIGPLPVNSLNYKAMIRPPVGFPPPRPGARPPLSSKPSPAASSVALKAPGGRPTFSLIGRAAKIAPLSDLDFMSPWEDGVGLTAFDWSSSGHLDVFTVHGNSLFMIEVRDAQQLKSYELNLSPVVSGLGLLDVSIADVHGTGYPQIIVQQYPGDLLILNWQEKHQAFAVEHVALPIDGISHVITHAPSGAVRIIVAGYDAKTLGDREVAVDFEPRGPVISNLSAGTSMRPMLGLLAASGVAAPTAEGDGVAVMRPGGVDSQVILDIDRAARPVDGLLMPAFSQTSAQLRRVNGQTLTIFPRPKFEVDKEKRYFYFTKPIKIEVCLEPGRDKRACLVRFAQRVSTQHPEYCGEIKDHLAQRMCRELTHRPSIDRRLNLKQGSTWGAMAYSSLRPIQYDAEWMLGLEQLGNAWHAAPVSLNANMEGFLIGRGGADEFQRRRLNWLHVRDARVVVDDVSDTLLPAPLDSRNFLVADFTGDGAPDIFYRCDGDLILSRGYWGTDPITQKPVSQQGGIRSRVLLEMIAPLNVKAAVKGAAKGAGGVRR